MEPSMRRFRFGLRHVFVLVAILSVLLALGGKRVADARKQRQLVTLIQSYGGESHHDRNFKDGVERTIRFSNMEFSPELPGPDWLRRLLGEEYFVSVAEAFFDKGSHRVLDDAAFAEFNEKLRSSDLPRPLGLVFSELPITDSTLQRLREFPDLRSLHILNCPKVSDAGLQSLTSLKKLRRLDLRGTSITDRGLASLSTLTELRELALSDTGISDFGLLHIASITNLQWLAMSNTGVTPDGAKRLKQHLPNCEMSW
jgi:Leucine-rich repeat (LRR) protein